MRRCFLALLPQVAIARAFAPALTFEDKSATAACMYVCACVGLEDVRIGGQLTGPRNRAPLPESERNPPGRRTGGGHAGTYVQGDPLHVCACVVSL